MEILNILLFPSGSQVANEIYNALKYEKNIICFGADNGYSNWSAYEMENYIGDIPIYSLDNKDEFIRSINNHIDKNNIHCIIPCFDKFITILKEFEKDLNCVVASPEIHISKICESKLETYKIFNSVFNVPKIYDIKEIENKITLDEPFFIKPIKWYGSRDSFKITTKTQFEYYKTHYDLNNFLICEYLPGDEFTVDCLSNDEGLIICCPRKRARTLQGISVNAEVVLEQSIIDDCNIIGNKIFKTLKMKGCWFFQVKFDKYNKLCLLEIAPRVAGAMCLTRNLGVNLPLLSIYIYLNKKIIINADDTCFKRKKCSVYKSFKNIFLPKLDFNIVFVDLDDTIILKNKVNIDCLSFLYHCKNQNKKIICITRNINPANKLEIYKISTKLFDAIFSLSNFEKKSDYINKNIVETDMSIFIDDSYLERKDVFKCCKNTMVFGLDQIESLF